MNHLRPWSKSLSKLKDHEEILETLHMMPLREVPWQLFNDCCAKSLTRAYRYLTLGDLKCHITWLRDELSDPANEFYSASLYHLFEFCKDAIVSKQFEDELSTFKPHEDLMLLCSAPEADLEVNEDEDEDIDPLLENEGTSPADDEYSSDS